MVIIFTFNFKIIQIVSIVSFFQTIMTIFSDFISSCDIPCTMLHFILYPAN